MSAQHVDASWRHGWSVRTEIADAPSHFAADPLAGAVDRAITVRRVTRATVVLGSAQPDTAVDHDAARAADVAVVRRRSGGGAVWLDPRSIVWVDVTIPRSDHRWSDDVGQAFWWLGERWAAAMGGDAQAYRGPLLRTSASASVCFAGLGPGEVRVGGRKVIGVSQRRARAGALFQCGVLQSWDPAPLLGVLNLPGAIRDAWAVELADVAAGVDEGAAGLARTADDVVDAFVRDLASSP